jgi:hypothetical protein
VIHFVLHLGFGLKIWGLGLGGEGFKASGHRVEGLGFLGFRV